MRISPESILLSVCPLLTSAIPEQPPIPTTTPLPTHYGVVLFPGFQAIDVFGTLDVLNLLSMLFEQTDMELSVLSRTLEPVTTGKYASHNLKMAESVVPTITFEQALLPDAKEIEVLLVPGGLGTRDDVSAEIDFVRKIFPRVCGLAS
jgi:putative intracellular protease/amidase